MAKKSPDYFKYWPIVVFLFGLAGSYFTLKASASEQDKRLVKVEDKVEEQQKEQSSILVNEAKIQGTLDQVLEGIKDLKAKK